ncbi:polymorphic toxin-type HINT domain-containing protein [Streptomyces chrestomyceticus]|uniref:polymorphic toxin-type HINT domain-containing protein n=1 Tax=Streptomyces chrestomyceticus TaxID=68185 RepID=UPI0033D81A40
MTSASAAAAVDAKSLDSTAAELAAEAAKPDADTKALAAKGRTLAMRALKVRGPWSQEAAKQALAGSDEDVLAYLRSGWQKAGLDEMREKVFQLSTQSEYEAVRTAAAAALKGSDQQIRDFYTTGQYEVAVTDLTVRVSQINNAGGPGVKEASKAALKDGRGKVLAAFIATGQYAAQHSDEEVAASKLVNTGGPEVKAAAKVALAGAAEEVHDFVQLGQYMADRKDQLAATHIAQVQHLVAEASVVAAEAQRNRWIAAGAAAKANNASDQAAKAADEAKKNAKLADGYRIDAGKAADSAEASAAQAAKSAKTARNAADNAQRDAADAENSAAQARFSFEYARASAKIADDAASEARASALKAGKSRDEATALASQAWGEVKKKREAEEAEARRKAEEERKRKEKEQSEQKICYEHPTHELAVLPCLAAGGKLKQVEPNPIVSAIAWEVADADTALKCVKDPNLLDCGSFVIGLTPWGKGFKIAGKFVGKVGGKVVEKIAKTVKKRKAIKCATCFPAGTKVLMGNAATKNIESVKVGDEVTATDPVGGTSGKRTVTALIVTEHDKQFNELTVATRRGSERITATHEHPFWSPSQKSWVKAAGLRRGMTLRAADGTDVTVRRNRPFTENARTYNLTVGGLHTYYVLAGRTPVLVHNANPCDPPLILLHSDSLDKSSLDFWHKQKTEDIIASLQPKAREPLIVKPDGTIMNGNTRITVLKSRGYDIDSLPRESYGKRQPTTDDEFWAMEQ